MLSGVFGASRRPSGLRKTNYGCNSLAHRTTWLRSDFAKQIEITADAIDTFVREK